MSPPSVSGWAAHQGFPRVSGDEPTRNPAIYVDWAFSPREWG